jgi:tRNA threonylcarbamoyladenosine biosynthesis protein TsaE
MRKAALETHELYDIVTHSPGETMAFGRRLASQLLPPTVVLLEGDLGSGKTTLAKGIAVGLGAAREEEVTSPTFTLVHEYAGTSKAQPEAAVNRVFHVDLYRIEDPQEISTLGLDEILDSLSTVLIEWGDRLGGEPAPPFFKVRLEYLNDTERRIHVSRFVE